MSVTFRRTEGHLLLPILKQEVFSLFFTFPPILTEVMLQNFVFLQNNNIHITTTRRRTLLLYSLRIMETLLFREHETLITSLSHCRCSRNIHISQLEYHGWKKKLIINYFKPMQQDPTKGVIYS